MLELFRRNWWVVALRGVAGLCFGVIALLWPGATIAALVLMFGSYAIVDGVLAIVSALRQRNAYDQVGLLWLEGILGIAVGVASWIWPGLSALALVYVIAGWAIATGVVEISAAIRLRKEIEGEWLLAAAGAVSIALGLAMAFKPLAGALGLLWMLGIYAMVFGAFVLALAISVRARTRHLPPAHAGRYSPSRG